MPSEIRSQLQAALVYSVLAYCSLRYLTRARKHSFGRAQDMTLNLLSEVCLLYTT